LLASVAAPRRCATPQPACAASSFRAVAGARPQPRQSPAAVVCLVGAAAGRAASACRCGRAWHFPRAAVVQPPC
jgi:hypothetical protein